VADLAHLGQYVALSSMCAPMILRLGALPQGETLGARPTSENDPFKHSAE
jgi:hypothetical protein